MTPYYQEPGITLYHIDCRELLPQLPRNSADLLLTDPPYGAKWNSGYRRRVPFGTMPGDHDQTLGLEAISLALKILRSYRHLYIFGRWPLLVTLPIHEAAELIWDKMMLGLGTSYPWGKSHEFIQFAVNLYGHAKAPRHGSVPARLRRGSVLPYLRPNAAAVRHPAEKPVPLLRELIESSSRIGELVLDPFAGSGSILVAAKLEARRAIGIEIEERWCELAAKRLRANDER